MKTKVFVWMPSATGFPYPETLINIFNQDCRNEVDIIFNRKNIVDRMPIQLARNEIVQEFFKSWADYLWFVDDDNPPAIDVLWKLILHDKDVVSALVPLRKWAYRLCIVLDWKPVESIEWMNWPLIEVENIGTWCVLLSKRVIQSVWNATEWNPYQFDVCDYVLNLKTNTPEKYTYQDKLITNWWEIYKHNEQWQIHKVKRMISEDLFFWEIARQCWYKFYADLRCHCRHFTGEQPYRSVKYEEWNWMDLD